MTALERARELVAAAPATMTAHDYQGLCPAGDTSPTARDAECPACRALDAVVSIAAAGMALRDMAIVNGMYAMSAHDVAELFDARIAAALGGDA